MYGRVLLVGTYIHADKTINMSAVGHHFERTAQNTSIRPSTVSGKYKNQQKEED